MNTSRQFLLKLVNEIPDSQVNEAIDFISYLKLKKETEIFKDLEHVSNSSMTFWDNDIDDEVWNDV